MNKESKGRMEPKAKKAKTENQNIKHRQADAKWRANLSKSFNLLESIVTSNSNAKGQGKNKVNLDKTTEKKLPRQVILDQVCNFIKEKETRITHLVRMKSAKLGLDIAKGDELKLYKNVFEYMENRNNQSQVFAEDQSKVTDPMISGIQSDVVQQQNEKLFNYAIDPTVKPPKCRRKLNWDDNSVQWDDFHSLLAHGFGDALEFEMRNDGSDIRKDVNSNNLQFGMYNNKLLFSLTIIFSENQLENANKFHIQMGFVQAGGDHNEGPIDSSQTTDYIDEDELKAFLNCSGDYLVSDIL